MKTNIPTTRTNANITQVMHLLANSPGQLERLSAGIPLEQLRRPLGAGERSFHEVLAHLVHCEARSAQAIYLALLADEPLLPDIHPERQWGRLLRFDRLEFSDLLAYFKVRRAVLLHVLTALTPEQWDRSVREEGKKRKESLYWKARALASHEHEHLTDLENKLERKRSKP